MHDATFDDLFAGGPPLKVQARIGLIEPASLHVARRIVLFVLVTWVPLLILAALGDLRLFLIDYGVPARLVIAGPLLIAGEAVCIRVLSRIARRLLDMCSAAGADVDRLVHVLASIRRWRDAPLVEVAAAGLAFGVSLAVIHGLPLSLLPPWHHAGGDDTVLSPAGWWYALVSLPLLLMLILGWVWRLLLWTRFLVVVARLDLKLVPVHPDKAAGLGFVGYSVRAYCLVGAALGSIVAGSVANQVVNQGATLVQFKFAIAGLVMVTLALFTAPLLVFGPRLLATWRQGVREYGELAAAFGRQFELEWFAQRRPLNKDVLERGDFSAATDLYQVVDRIHDLRLVPLDYTSIALLAGATLLPFVPVVLIALPFDVVLDAVVGLLR